MAVLFISRGTISGVQGLVDHVCESTRARCLSREDLVREVSRRGSWATDLVEQLSRATSTYEEFSKTRRAYLVLMRQALLEHIQEDRVIYHGLSGHLLLPRLPHFVRVRVCEPLSQQISDTMNRLHCDSETARRQIREAEELHVRWARFIYARDVRDPTLYDMIINLGHFSPEGACNLIGRILEDHSLDASAETQAEMGRLLLAANIEAALVTDPRTRNYEIACTVSIDSLRLEGPYLDEADRKVVTDIARAIGPDRAVIYSPGYATQYRLEERSEFLAGSSPSVGA